MQATLQIHMLQGQSQAEYCSEVFQELILQAHAHLVISQIAQVRPQRMMAKQRLKLMLI